MRSIATAAMAVLLTPLVGAATEVKTKSAHSICRATPGNLRYMVKTAEALENLDLEFAIVAAAVMANSDDCIVLQMGDAVTVLSKPRQRPGKGVVTARRQGRPGLYYALVRFLDIK